MRLFRSRPKPGTIYHGPAAWCDDYSIVPRPFYYALSDDGRTVLANRPLVCVDDAPGVATNGACHYEHAGPGDMPQRRADLSPVPAGRVVELEAAPHGTSEVEAS